MSLPLQIHPEPDGTQLHFLLGQERSRIEICLDWLQTQPLLVPACGFLLGIALDARWHLQLGWAAMLLVLCGGLLMWGRRHMALAYLGVGLAAMAAGAVRHDLAMRCWPVDHIARFVSPAGADARLRAVVIEPPRLAPVSMGSVQWMPSDPRTRLLVDVLSITGQRGDIAVSGVVAVSVREPALHVSDGDIVELFGHLYYPSPPRNPDEVDFATRSQRQGVLLRMVCDNADNVTVLDTHRAGYHWLGRYRRWARQAMLQESFLGQEAGAQLLASMVVGERSAVDPALNEVFAATGTIHYLSVSGAHVGMLAGVIWLISWLLGLSRRSMALRVLVVIAAYAFLAEPQAPILRAALIGFLMCVAVLASRPVRQADWLALAALLLCLCHPSQLFELDFQLSFISVVSLLFIQPRLSAGAEAIYWWWRGGIDHLLTTRVQDLLTPPSRLRRGSRSFGRALRTTITVTVAATLGTLPLSLHYFYRLSLWGWLNNILVLPLMWFVQIVGLFKTVVAFVWPSMADLLGPPLAWATNLLIEEVYLLARLPGSHAVMPAMPRWLAGLFFLAVALWLAAPGLRIPKSVVALSCGLWLVIAAWQLSPPGAGRAMHVDVLAVGNGTCCTISLPNGKNLIYDLGSIPPFDMERWIVGPHLAQQAITRLDAVLLSHADLDHYSALPDVAQRFRVEQILSPRHFQSARRTSWSVARLFDETQCRRIPWHTVSAGDRLGGTGQVAVEILWPPQDWREAQGFNNSSMVVRLSYGGRRVLLCGDIEDAAQERLLQMADLRADVLLLPHHGSVRSSTRRFIAAVNPQYCIRSSGRQTSLAPGALAEIVKGRQYYNTAENGAVTISVAPNQVEVRPWKNAVTR